MKMFKIKTEMYRGTVEYRIPAASAVEAEGLFVNEIYREGYHHAVARAETCDGPMSDVVRSRVTRPNRSEDGRRLSPSYSDYEYVQNLTAGEIERGTGWVHTGHGHSTKVAATHDGRGINNLGQLRQNLKGVKYNGKSDRDALQVEDQKTNDGAKQ